MMRLCWHKWSNWSDPVTTYSGNLQQWRICKKCNKAMFKNLRWHKQTPLSVVLSANTKAKGESE
jgi:hypothetical protein